MRRCRWPGTYWMDLIQVGTDEEDVGQQLETKGVDKFAISYRRSLTSSRQDEPSRRMKDPYVNCDKAG